MHRFHIHSEKPTARGWEYLVQLNSRDGGDSTEHIVRLDWSDFEFWCHGVLAPSRVMEAVLQFVLDHSPSTECALPPVFDAAVVRRWHRHADQALTLLRRSA